MMISQTVQELSCWQTNTSTQPPTNGHYWIFNSYFNTNKHPWEEQPTYWQLQYHNWP